MVTDMINKPPIVKMHGQHDPNTSLSHEARVLQFICERIHVRNMKSALKEMERNLR